MKGIGATDKGALVAPQWLRPKEAAAELGCSLRTLQNMAKRGQVMRRREGRTTRYCVTGSGAVAPVAPNGTAEGVVSRFMEVDRYVAELLRALEMAREHVEELEERGSEAESDLEERGSEAESDLEERGREAQSALEERAEELDGAMQTEWSERRDELEAMLSQISRSN